MQKLFGLLAIALVSLGSTLSSFTPKPGGDSFEVFLDGKRVFQQYVHSKEGLKSFSLDQSNADDKLSVVYSHCGVQGKSRSIAIKDKDGKELKKWTFGDTKEKTQMSINAKDILAFSKNAKIGLYYASKEMPEGKLLASIKLGANLAKK